MPKDAFVMPAVRRMKNKVDIAISVALVMDGTIEDQETSEQKYIDNIIDFLKTKKEDY